MRATKCDRKRRSSSVVQRFLLPEKLYEPEPASSSTEAVTETTDDVVASDFLSPSTHTSESTGESSASVQGDFSSESRRHSMAKVASASAGASNDCPFLQLRSSIAVRGQTGNGPIIASVPGTCVITRCHSRWRGGETEQSGVGHGFSKANASFGLNSTVLSFLSTVEEKFHRQVSTSRVTCTQ